MYSMGESATPAANSGVGEQNEFPDSIHFIQQNPTTGGGRKLFLPSPIKIALEYLKNDEYDCRSVTYSILVLTSTRLPSLCPLQNQMYPTPGQQYREMRKVHF